jgi:S1-C subfamily serine protease
MSVLEELQTAVASVAQQVGPAVVGIGQRQRGSGVIVANGRIVTNAHNLRGGETTVRFADGRTATGRVAGVDWDGDLAVVEVDTSGATPLGFGDGQPAVGAAVFGAAATPSGAPRVTVGFVSSVERAFRGPGGRRIAGSVEHTAPLASGSSGGALVDAAGKLVGLNTNRVGEGFYLALPADGTFQDRLEALARGEEPSRPRLGIAVAPSAIAIRMRQSVGLPAREGLLVRGVEDDSLAAKAGILEGDLIVEVAGQAVTEVDALYELLGKVELPFEVKLVRGTEERTVSVGGGDAQGEA